MNKIKHFVFHFETKYLQMPLIKPSNLLFHGLLHLLGNHLLILLQNIDFIPINIKFLCSGGVLDVAEGFVQLGKYSLILLSCCLSVMLFLVDI